MQMVTSSSCESRLGVPSFSIYCKPGLMTIMKVDGGILAASIKLIGLREGLRVFKVLSSAHRGRTEQGLRLKKPFVLAVQNSILERCVPGTFAILELALLWPLIPDTSSAAVVRISTHVHNLRPVTQ